MPVTKTAKRALRGSNRKTEVNKLTTSKLEAAIRTAKKQKTEKSISDAISLTDRAAKKNIIHKNRSARIKSTLSKLRPARVAKKTIQSKKTKTSPKKK